MRRVKMQILDPFAREEPAGRRGGGQIRLRDRVLADSLGGERANDTPDGGIDG